MFIQPREDALGSSTIRAPLFTQDITAGLLTLVTLHASGCLWAGSPTAFPHSIFFSDQPIHVFPTLRLGVFIRTKFYGSLRLLSIAAPLPWSCGCSWGSHVNVERCLAKCQFAKFNLQSSLKQKAQPCQARTWLTVGQCWRFVLLKEIPCVFA